MQKLSSYEHAMMMVVTRGYNAMLGSMLVGLPNGLCFAKIKTSRKVSHLSITYDCGADLYNVRAEKFNRKTFEMKSVKEVTGIQVADLANVCENILGCSVRL